MTINNGGGGSGSVPDVVTGPGGIAGGSASGVVNVTYPGAGNLYWMTLSGNVTALNLPASVAGKQQPFNLRIDQPAVGGPFTVVLAGTPGTDWVFPALNWSSTGTGTLDYLLTKAGAQNDAFLSSNGSQWAIYPANTGQPPISPTGNMLYPIAGRTMLYNSTLTVAANRLYVERFLIPAAGKVRNLMVNMAAGVTGNALTGIWDTSSPRQNLYTQPASVSPTAAQWDILSDPQLAVGAGQMIDVGFMFDNATATVTAGNFNTAQMMLLPSYFLPGLGAAAKLYATADQVGFTIPSTITEGSLNAGTGVKLPLIVIGLDTP